VNGRRILVTAYALVAYATFVVATLWAVGFLADRWAPTTLDGRPGPNRGVSLLVDAGLLGLFAVQHSVMARDWFKRRAARLVPAQVERSTYVLVASLLLILLEATWQALPATVWSVTSPVWTTAIWIGYGIGWVTAVSATFMVDHLDFLGLRQALRPTGAPPPFMVRWLYTLVRHPMMTGLLVAFWATPHLTVGHLLFAAASTGYILLGIRFEERDLRAKYGRPYLDYAARVPALVPRPKALGSAPESRRTMPGGGR
jgi:protein-S-isoprenylcysteine O-methyltransferase Ste14